VRKRISREVIENGIKLVRAENSIRSSAKMVGIGATTLRRALKQEKRKGDKVRELRFIPIYDFKLVPRYLFEQVKMAQGWNIDRLYEYGTGVTKNPCMLVFAMVNAEFLIKGLLWVYIDPLREIITVQLLTVDQEYQDHGKPLEYAKEFLRDIKKKFQLKGIEWATNKPRAFERIGARRTGHIIMEL